MRTPENEKAVSGGSGTALDTAHVADDSKKGDFVTVLNTFGKLLLTKVFHADGTVNSYDDALSFVSKEVEVSDLRGLSRLLDKLQENPHRSVIRGKLTAGTPEPGKVEGSISRTNANFDDCPHHWLSIDIDKYKPGFADPVHEPEQAILDFIDEMLPPCFKGCSFYWQLSSSAGTKGSDFRSFDELAASPGYRDLTPAQKDQARERYFVERIAPAIAPDKQQGHGADHRPHLQPQPDATDSGTDLRAGHEPQQLHGGDDRDAGHGGPAAVHACQGQHEPDAPVTGYGHP